jgi:adenine phosphoribosyltransferase
VPIRKEAGLFPGRRVLLVDDWVETGSQAALARSLIEDCRAAFAGVAAIVDQLPQARASERVRVHGLVPAALLDSDP